jgi:hypothetical protein
MYQIKSKNYEKPNHSPDLEVEIVHVPHHGDLFVESV